ncbi:MAG: protein-S-isoprenylcysteine O-methyltransferase [Planctomycetota bacterium]
MNPLLVKAIVVQSILALFVVPALAHRRDGEAGAPRSHKGRTERIVLGLMALGIQPPLVWVASPWLGFADQASRPELFFAGLVTVVAGLWLLYETHAALGTNWSITLEVHEEHALVTHGVYARLRHPMYLALLLYALGLALMVPNWVAGPSYLVAVVLLVCLRLGPEERMMREEFGAAYEAYVERTKRLLPGIW